ncbi:DUF2063 domain-containing protein [bacterium]|nr:DUF2063 domain-containing protein [bacterium]
MSQWLADFQKRFVSRLDSSGELAWIKAKDTEEQNARFNIYKNGCNIRFKEALIEDFPITEKLMGKDLFLKNIESFIIENPSTYYTLNEYSRTFPDFLAKVEPQNNLWKELSLFEWNLIQCRFQGSNKQKAIALEESTGSLQIQIERSIVLQECSFPVDLIYEDEEIHPTENRCYIFCVEGSTPCYESISTFEHDFFAELLRNTPLETAFERLQEKHSNLDHESVSSFFQKWGAKRLLSLGKNRKP